MPTYLKIIITLCVEMFLIVTGGAVGAWLPVRNIPAGEGRPGNSIGMFIFGMTGMIVAGMVGVVILVIFWSGLAMRCEAAGRKIGDINPAVPQAEGVWPPSPKR